MILDSAALACLAERGATVHDWLVWIEARNRASGLTEAVGFWSGGDDRTFIVDGVPRPYIGVGHALRIPSITHQPGPVVRLQSIELLGISDKIEDAFLNYDARQAPVQLHLALFDRETRNLVSLVRAGRGWLDKVPAKFGGLRGTSGIRATMASVSRLLTRSLPLKKSDQVQKRRKAGGQPDRFRRYGSISGAVPVWWGENRKVPVEPNSPPSEDKGEDPSLHMGR